MNGPDFFMRHVGYRLLPPDQHTKDAVTDANRLFGLSLALHTGKTLRLSSCWMVVTPQWVATSFKALRSLGFRHDMERKTAIQVGRALSAIGIGQTHHGGTRPVCHPRPARSTLVQRGRSQNI